MFRRSKTVSYYLRRSLNYDSFESFFVAESAACVCINNTKATRKLSIKLYLFVTTDFRSDSFSFRFAVAATTVFSSK